MFGGQFLAQGIAAVQTTVPADRRIHSLHAYFLRPGDTGIPIHFTVDRTREGRSFNHRETRAYQNDKELFRMICSYAITVSSYDFLARKMPTVPRPAEVTYTYEDFCRDQMPDQDYIRDIQKRPLEILYINPPPTRTKSDSVESQRMWIRIRGDVGEETWKHDAGLAYVSDSTLIDHITLPHGRRWQDPDFEGTSLDHAMWFHNNCKANEWLLYDQDVEWTGDGRGLASARLYQQDGTLVATCVQEGLMRF